MKDTSTCFWQAWLTSRQRLFELGLRRMGGNRADTEDVLSTAMLQALESFPRQASQLFNVKAWLARILLNACVDLHRARRSRRDTPLGNEEEALLEDVMLKEVPSPEQLLLQHEQLQTLWKQLAALPEPLRQPCAMRFEQGMAYEDIARELGLTHVNVRRRILISYRYLRAALGHTEQMAPGDGGRKARRNSKRNPKTSPG